MGLCGSVLWVFREGSNSNQSDCHVWKEWKRIANSGLHSISSRRIVGARHKYSKVGFKEMNMAYIQSPSSSCSRNQHLTLGWSNSKDHENWNWLKSQISGMLAGKDFFLRWIGHRKVKLTFRVSGDGEGTDLRIEGLKSGLNPMPDTISWSCQRECDCPYFCMVFSRNHVNKKQKWHEQTDIWVSLTVTSKKKSAIWTEKGGKCPRKRIY